MYADGPVERLVESARNGEITQEQLAQSLLQFAEVDQGSVANPEIIILRFPGLVDVIGAKLVERVTAHIKGENRDAVRQLQVFAERMLGTQSAYTQQIIRLVDLDRKYEALVSRGTVDTAAAFRVELTNTVEQDIFLPKLQQFMRDTIALQANQAQPFESLVNLMQLGRVSRPQELVDAVERILFVLQEQAQSGKIDWSKSTLKDPRVEKFLGDLVKDSSTASEYALTLESAFAAHEASAGRYESAQEALAKVLRARPDPHAANTELRKRILFSLQGEGAAALAEELIAALLRTGELTFSEKTRLYSAGYYGRGTLLTVFVVVIGLLLGSIALLFGIGKLVPELSPDHLYNQLQEMRRQRAINRSKKRGVGYMSVIEDDDEYSKLLRQFGLDDSASESDIKKAYRRLVKEHHPDAHGAGGRVVDADGNEDRRFEELKKNYQRLLEMRGSFFGR